MKIYAYLYDWGEPVKEGQQPFEYLWELTDPKYLQNLMILFGNGVIGELRTEADSDNALLALRWVMRSAGGCIPHELTEGEKQNLLLYQNNYECHLQEGDPPGYIFVNPQPNPARFE